MNLALVQGDPGVGEPIALYLPPMLEVVGFEGEASAKEEDRALVLDHVPEPCTAVHEQVVLLFKVQAVFRRCIVSDAHFIVVGGNQMPLATKEYYGAIIDPRAVELHSIARFHLKRDAVVAVG